MLSISTRFVFLSDRSIPFLQISLGLYGRFVDFLPLASFQGTLFHVILLSRSHRWRERRSQSSPCDGNKRPRML